MTADMIWIAAILAFFGVFAVTLFFVSIWSAGPRREPAKAAEQQPTPARRPEPASAPEMRWRGAERVH